MDVSRNGWLAAKHIVDLLPIDILGVGRRDEGAANMVQSIFCTAAPAAKTSARMEAVVQSLLRMI